MNPINIRPASTADAAIIADLSRQTFYETFALANTPENMNIFMSEQFSSEQLINEVDVSHHWFFLASVGDETAGYVFMREGEHYTEFGDLPSIEIARIYVLQTAIGKGVGSALLKKCIDTARNLKKEILWLGVWENNQRAIDFYTKCGFEKFGDHEFVLGKDIQRDWLMKKKLP